LFDVTLKGFKGRASQLPRPCLASHLFKRHYEGTGKSKVWSSSCLEFAELSE